MRFDRYESMQNTWWLENHNVSLVHEGDVFVGPNEDE
jgi:hypothetical protein